MTDAKPLPGAEITVIHVGAANVATFSAVATAAGVLINGRPGLGLEIHGPYFRETTPPTDDAPGVFASTPSWLISVDAGRIARMAALGEALTTTPAELIAQWQANGLPVTRDGVSAYELNGVWLWNAPPPGAWRVAGATL